MAISNRLFSTDSTKAEKAQGFGYLNGIHYLAPFDIAGVGNVCSHASPACAAACLGWHSGQSAFGEVNSCRTARIEKTREFMANRPAYMRALARQLARAYAESKRKGLGLCIRLNGSSDIGFERQRVEITPELAQSIARLTGGDYAPPPGVYSSLMALYPGVPFVDYTKNPLRFARPLPENYHLTFSRSETNEADALALLARGVNVAVVFDAKPERWRGFDCIDGDAHDLRFLDPRGARGFVVALSPKGRKAKRDASGFVVRLPELARAA